MSAIALYSLYVWFTKVVDKERRRVQTQTRHLRRKISQGCRWVT